MRAGAENRALTGLRGCAALLVCVHHLVLHIGAPPSPAQAFALRGYLMVDLFFVLSGFVMALAYEGWFAGPTDPATYVRFLWRRFRWRCFCGLCRARHLQERQRLEDG